MIFTSIYIHRCPDEAPASKKMVHSGSVEDLKKAATGYHIYIQANDRDECSHEEVAGKVEQK